MLYSIHAKDHDGSLKARRDARPAHIARLKELLEEGRLFAAGPHPAIDSEDPGAAGFSGSLIIAEFPSLEAAQAWADADPYFAAGVYAEAEVQPFVLALP
ncbi:MAG: YciI family protein [Gammaproteobacteria bacterium]|nr:YciI family protein [Gammaproteobacteria bacterium]